MLIQNIHRTKLRGFTLLEILIALFIFTILSFLLMGGLRSVINTQSRTEESADTIRQWQLAFLLIENDVSQILNRPVLSANGKEELPFIGDQKGFTFTHLGFSDPMGNAQRSAMSRTRYYYDHHQLYRANLNYIDRAPTTQPTKRVLLGQLEKVTFQYLDENKKFQSVWPVDGASKNSDPLPNAVSIRFVFKRGELNQLYIINANEKNNANN